VTRVELHGDLDLYTAPELSRHLEALIGAGHLKLLVDLTNAAFIDSTTIGVLLSAWKRLRASGGRLAVVCPQPAMRDLFELVGHNWIFPVYERPDGAFAHLL
jgi:anti-sigma B factor antagonist